MKLSKILSTILLVSLFNACINDDEGVQPPDFPEINRGPVEVNRVILDWFPKSDTTAVRSFEYFDSDGNGGNPPSINEQIVLEYPRSASFKPYIMRIRLFNNQTEVTSVIDSLGTKYIICYRDQTNNNLRLNELNTDKNGITLGTESDWSTQDNSSRTGNIRITLNFQDAGKNGLCDPGIRIFDGTMNYLLN